MIFAERKRERDKFEAQHSKRTKLLNFLNCDKQPSGLNPLEAREEAWEVLAENFSVTRRRSENVNTKVSFCSISRSADRCQWRHALACGDVPKNRFKIKIKMFSFPWGSDSSVARRPHSLALKHGRYAAHCVQLWGIVWFCHRTSAGSTGYDPRENTLNCLLDCDQESSYLMGYYQFCSMLFNGNRFVRWSVVRIHLIGHSFSKFFRLKPGSRSLSNFSHWKREITRISGDFRYHFECFQALEL